MEAPELESCILLRTGNFFVIQNPHCVWLWPMHCNGLHYGKNGSCSGKTAHTFAQLLAPKYKYYCNWTIRMKNPWSCPGISPFIWVWVLAPEATVQALAPNHESCPLGMSLWSQVWVLLPRHKPLYLGVNHGTNTCTQAWVFSPGNEPLTQMWTFLSKHKPLFLGVFFLFPVHELLHPGVSHCIKDEVVVFPPPFSIWLFQIFHPNYSETYFMNIFKCFDDYHMLSWNWPHYIWTSLCQVPFYYP